MTRDDIIRMAREAGMPRLSLIDIGYLEKFAALVAAAEREACARLVGAKIQETQIYSNPSHLVQVAAAIRAREAKCKSPT